MRRQPYYARPKGDGSSWIAIVVLFVGAIALNLGQCAKSEAQGRPATVEELRSVVAWQERRLAALEGAMSDLQEIASEVHTAQVIVARGNRQGVMLAEIERLKRITAELEAVLPRKGVDPATSPVRSAM